MKGSVLAFSIQKGNGVISGDDGKRYKFLASSWQAEIHPVQGQRVDFEVTPTGEALDIYLDILTSSSSGGSGAKERTTAALLAFFLGAFGAHKFYLGRQQAGTIMLLVSLFGSFLIVPIVVMGVVALVEFIIYLTKTDQEFQQIYVIGKKEWF